MKAMWNRIILLLLASNVIILVVGVLRANFVDTVNFSLRTLLDPWFWLRNPALLLILALYGLCFFSSMLASRSASVISQTRLTASVFMAVSLQIGSVFTLVKLWVYQNFRGETITPTMWIWASVATLCISVSCVALYLFLAEGQKVIVA